MRGQYNANGQQRRAVGRTSMVSVGSVELRDILAKILLVPHKISRFAPEQPAARAMAETLTLLLIGGQATISSPGSS